MPSEAIIYLCKGRPSRSGGGLGVAYNYLSAAWGEALRPAEADHILLCGQAILALPQPDGQDLDACLASLDPGSLRGARLFAWQASQVRRLTKRYHKVVVFAFTPFYLWPLVRLTSSGWIQLVHSEHSKGGRHNELAEERGRFGWRERFVQWCVGWNFRFPDQVVFPSRGAQVLFEEKNPALAECCRAKAVVLHNGVVPSEPPVPRMPGPGLMVVSIAHHVREKGLDVLMRGLGEAVRSGVDCRLVNFGQPGPVTANLESLAMDEGITGRIRLAGLQPQAQVREELAKADVFLHTPAIVVFDLSLLEAMMHAVPVVTTPLEGNREALGDDYPLYASSFSEVAARLRWIADHREEAARIGASLRARALRFFTNEAMTNAYADFLNRMMGR